MAEITVTDAMVEAAATELLAHAVCTEIGDAQNKRLMLIAARAALQAALSKRQPTTVVGPTDTGSLIK